jgi:hypothetical protein
MPGAIRRRNRTRNEGMKTQKHTYRGQTVLIKSTGVFTEDGDKILKFASDLETTKRNANALIDLFLAKQTRP